MMVRNAGYKIFSSFALVALGAIALYRLVGEAGFSARVAPAAAVIVILMGAAAWRGLLYVRYLRTGAKP